MAEVTIKIIDTDKPGEVEVTCEFIPPVEIEKIMKDEIKPTMAQTAGALLMGICQTQMKGASVSCS
jgi:hypothetical protein